MPLKDYMQKQAGWQDTAKRVGTGALAGGAAAAGGAMIGAVANTAAQKIMDAVTKKFEFRSMMEQNPDLHEHFEADPKRFNQMYSSLRSVSPAFGSDPIIAGQYMREMARDPMFAGGKLVQLAKDSPERRSSPLAEAFGRGALEGAKPVLSGKGGKSEGQGSGGFQQNQDEGRF